MAVETKQVTLPTQGRDEIRDITPEVARAVRSSAISSGTVTIFVPGSTAGVTTIEYEPNVVADLADAIRRLVPENMPYRHNAIDDNGHSHVRAALVGPSLTVPFVNKELLLGTWQQIVLIDFDTHPRQRRLIFQIVGE
ncbi:MAG: secondary thiamine-phosphate synthase enzyme YjbQ [Blastocatellia bacterium]|nr:secondary thiamine-phosphate synthase enzyme YjbQ [Blastocatellia bacterium]MCS7158419.1 secondary thiamine-phosphate synthase enzyme YjbQ [Blastocatellia bacterium]MCX7752925.1 secondary thiamine-phosphate synthase enzyme YjbQ [Blastocatellia bacterium]MDW8167981.1 secondary thiamine-phosphate synthase enzyme YjbQ [Acidobacteriota bacterium]MDW8256356.1 secondary thiamine-phosphate synthase enzyme YjbQ [Acidobacteriota bacterium]